MPKFHFKVKNKYKKNEIKYNHLFYYYLFIFLNLFCLNNILLKNQVLHCIFYTKKHGGFKFKNTGLK